MSKIDEKYINALDTFTSALEEIVETLKEQQKSGKSDAVNDFLKTPMDNLSTVVKDLKNITEKGFKDVKSSNEQILKEIKSIKEQKSSGAFDKIEDPKNKNKIVDGIKVIMLIAGGVLALGMAFKIIGKVDFLSVIALSAAIVSISYAYSKIAKIENLDYAKSLIISSILPIIALGLLASGFILKAFPVIGLMQGLSMIIVSATIGVATYLLLKSIKGVDLDKNKKMIFALPIVLPAVALGLLMSGFIMKSFPVIGLMQGLSMIIVSATIGIATYLIFNAIKGIDLDKNKKMIFALPIVLPAVALGLFISSVIMKSLPVIGLMQGLSMIIVSATIGIATYLLLKSIKGVDFDKNKKMIFALPIVLPLVALGIVLSSIIIQKFVKIKNPIDLLIGSAVIGLSVLFFTPTIILLGKMDLKQIGKGALAIPMIALAIVATSWIFKALPSKMNYPDWKWTLSVGLSVTIFALIVTGVGYLATKFKKEFDSGLLGVVGVAAVIIASDFILNKGTYDRFPDWKWSLQTGLSVAIFGIIAYGVGFLASKDSEGFSFGLVGVVGISAAIFASDWILSKGEYKKYPDFEYSKGLGLSLGVFSVGALALGLIVMTGGGAVVMLAGLASILVIAASMLAVDKIFSLGDFTKYPSEEWAKGVGKSMLLFSSFGSDGKESSGFLDAVSSAVTGVVKGVGGAATSTAMIPIAKNMLEVDKIFSQGNFTKYPTTDWATNVATSFKIFSNQFKSMSAMSENDPRIKTINLLSDSFLRLSNSLSSVNSKLDTFTTNFNKINTDKLVKVLEANQPSQTLNYVNEPTEKSAGLFSTIGNYLFNDSTKNAANVSQTSVSGQNVVDTKRQNQFYDDVSEIRSILSDLREDMNKPSQAGSFHK
jgi:hypothetical protein